MDLVVLTESHWQTDMEWQDSAWSCMHFGLNSKTHVSIVVMVSRRLCSSQDISSVHIHPGRLAHIRIHAEPRPIDVIAVYQHAGTATSTVLKQFKQRQTVWTALDQYLHRLPHRNMLLCLGDFNCHLPTVPALAPASSFRTHLQTKAAAEAHSDRAEFVQFVKTHQLIGLNRFDTHMGFTNGQVTSKIAFVFTRSICADKQSKEFRPHQDFPLLADSTCFHVPLISSMPLHWPRKYIAKRYRTVTLHQREQCHYARAAGTDAWTAFEHQMQELLQPPWKTTATHLEQVHAQIRLLFDLHFPPQGCPQPSTQVDVHAGRHAAHAKAWRQQRVTDMLSEATRAAASHDTYKVYQPINRLAPKTVKKRVQLRDSSGMPLGPLESHAALAQFVRSMWDDPTWSAPPTALNEVHLNRPALSASLMPFTCQELEVAIRKLNWTKAVASQYASGGSIAPFASTLAQKLYAISDYGGDKVHRLYRQPGVTVGWYGSRSPTSLPRNLQT